MITVVIPNYNGEGILKPCLDALLTQSLKGIEVIIIDNHSVDGSLDLISQYPFRIIQNKENLGFSKAVNQGIREALHPYVFLLNSDVILSPETLAVLLDEMQSDPKIFSVQPKMMQFYSPNLIDDAGDLYTPFGWAFQLGHGLDDRYYNTKRETFSCCAGAALYRKAILDQIGLFDENFFAYMEDVDLGFRGRRHGYRNVYVPGTKVSHIGSASFGKKMTPLRAKLSGQNNYLTVRKNMPTLIMLMYLPCLVIGFILKWLKFVSQGHGHSFIQGIQSGIALWRQHSIRSKLSRCDLSLIPLMIRDTFQFVQWKLRKFIRH